ncbi:MAG TPA: F0F1 ATP synthase subunit delta, partial [Candidatus Saccharibacteria bacterium]|nr:F0F1 ATP synthase subunit delta [Candidatus Saccharibacteria bacterium]
PTTPGYKEDIKKLHYLLSHDISPGVQTFTQYLIDSNQLGVLLNDAGKAFPDYCQTHFSEMKHLTVVTAVAMSLEAQTKIRVMLLRHYSLNTRILFEVSSEVIAGFKLYDNHGMLADYSVHAKMVKLIEKYIRRKMPFHGIK